MAAKESGNDQVFNSFNKRLGLAVQKVKIRLPHLAGLVEKITIEFGEQVATAGIFASGRMILNPVFFNELDDETLSFVIAHEVLHLVFRSHERCNSTDAGVFNIAHDYIINAHLGVIWGFIPEGYLNWWNSGLLHHQESACDLSAEEICERVKSYRCQSPGDCVDGSGDSRASQTALAKALLNAGFSPANELTAASNVVADDVLSSHLEQKWFPNGNQRERINRIDQEITKAMACKKVMESLDFFKGSEPGDSSAMIKAANDHFAPPWEMALQQWMESGNRGDRSFAKPSRRGAARQDVVLPGHNRNGWTLHIILDVSGSMVSDLPIMLGLISEFGMAAGVDEVHLVQADTEVTQDKWITLPELYDYQINGMGGSDMTSAMQRLALDPEVDKVLVLTDGYIDYASEVPYIVFWGVINNRDFHPAYGTVVHIA